MASGTEKRRRQHAKAFKMSAARLTSSGCLSPRSARLCRSEPGPKGSATPSAALLVPMLQQAAWRPTCKRVSPVASSEVSLSYTSHVAMQILRESVSSSRLQCPHPDAPPSARTVRSSSSCECADGRAATERTRASRDCRCGRGHGAVPVSSAVASRAHPQDSATPLPPWP